MLMHFFGGAWIALFFVWLLGGILGESLKFQIMKILPLVLLVGLGWEVFEMLVNDVIAQNPFDFKDTSSDIFADLLGGFCAMLYLHLWRKKQPR